MLDTEKRLRELIKKGQGYRFVDGKCISDYKGFVRRYTATLNEIVNFKRTTDMGLSVYEVRGFIEMINPELKNEIDWLKDVENVLIEWHDNKVKVDRILGIKYYEGD